MHPILFSIGPSSHPFAVHTFGVVLMIAFLAGIWRSYAVAKKNDARSEGITPDNVLDAGMWMIISGIIGARLLFVIIDWPSYQHNLRSMFALWEGGISFHGGLLGGLLALIIYCNRKHIPLARLADIVAPSVMLAYAIGRIGCFFNGCCYGAPTNMPWGVRFFDDGHWTVPSHPTQLYASMLSFIFFAGLVWLEKRKAFDGQVVCWYVLGASVERFVMEIWRAGVTSSQLYSGLTDVQWLCVTMAVSATVVLQILRRRSILRHAHQDIKLEVAGH
jgi:phosphatidylglycerol---prolipoprotein diacylglyceryl transferase